MLALVMDDLSLVYYIAKYLERGVLSTKVNHNNPDALWQAAAGALC